MSHSTGTPEKADPSGTDKIKELDSRVKALEETKTRLQGAASLGAVIWTVVGGVVVALVLSAVMSGLGFVWSYAVLTTEAGHLKSAVEKLESSQQSTSKDMEARLTASIKDAEIRREKQQVKDSDLHGKEIAELRKAIEKADDRLRYWENHGFRVPVGASFEDGIFLSLAGNKLRILVKEKAREFTFDPKLKIEVNGKEVLLKNANLQPKTPISYMLDMLDSDRIIAIQLRGE
jgi:hypothetical protein